MSEFLTAPAAGGSPLLFTDDYTVADTATWRKNWLQLMSSVVNAFNFVLDAVNDELDIIGVFGGSTDMMTYAPASLGGLQLQQDQFSRATIQTAPGGGTNGLHLSVFNGGTMLRAGTLSHCYALEIGPEGAASYRIRKFTNGPLQSTPLVIANLLTIVQPINQGDTFDLRGSIAGANINLETFRNGVSVGTVTDVGAAAGFGFGLPGIMYRTNTLNTSVFSAYSAGALSLA